MKAKLKDNTIQITFQYDPDLVQKMRSLDNRKWNPDFKRWECAPIKQNIEKLAKWGFDLDDEIINLTLPKKEKIYKEIEIPFDFSLCPLYNGIRKIIYGNLIGEKHNANRDIFEDKSTIRRNEEKFSFGSSTKSQNKSDDKIKKECARPTMEKKSISEYKKSDAYSRDTKETFDRIKESEEEIWKQFQRREWTTSDKNHQISQQTILEMWIHKGISNPNKTCQTYLSDCSDCIQSRLCASNTENSNRIRWDKSQTQKTTKERQEENKNSNSPWMECHSFAALQSLKLIPGLQKGLYKFQLEDVFFLIEKHGRALIGSEMGLGKTVQAVAYLQAFPKIRPVLVICPKSAIGTWEREIDQCMTDKKQIHVLNGKTIKEIPPANIYIINYDILSSWIDALLDMPFELVVMDEIHRIKSRKTNRTIAAQLIGKKTEKIIGLTGTPIQNRPQEIYNAISLISPKLFPNFFQFAKRYCNAKQSRWGWDFTGSSNTQELHEILTSTCMIRRLKKDVLPDLPEKTRTIIPVKIDNMSEYKFAERSFSEWLLETKDKICTSAESLTQIEYLKQIAAKGKLQEIFDWIEDVIEQEEKLVIMAHHKEIIQEICDWLEKKSISYVKLIGGSSDKERKEAEEKFQTDEVIKVFVGSSAAEEAITLTAASIMAIVELPWTPGSLDQREDRIHRIGQTKGCNYYYFVGEKTIEEAILKLIDSKRKVITAVLDGKDVDEKSILSELLNELRNQNSLG